MPDDMKDVTITLSFEDFKELSTDAAVEVIAEIGGLTPELAMFSARLLARTATKLFHNDELIIEEEEN